MTISKNNLYIFLSTLFLASCFWIFLHQKYTDVNFEICIFKKVTNLPCVACGTTTSVLAFFEGDFLNALLINPLGYVAILLLVIIPIWIFKDVFLNKSSFYKLYQKVDNKLKKPIIYIPLILLLLSNWIWNIIKSL